MSIEYKLVVKKYVQPGKFTQIHEAINSCTPENRPYPGDECMDLVVYKTILRNKTLFCYCTERTNEILKNVPYLIAKVEWPNGGLGLIEVSPKKYVLGKKCYVGKDRFFIFGEVKANSNVYEIKKSRANVTATPIFPSCAI